MERQEQVPHVADTRNGKLRRIARPIVEQTLNVVEKTGLTPNQITVIGNCLAFSSAAHATYINWNNDASFGAQTGILVEGLMADGTDGIDGGLARRQGKASFKGQLIDAVSDRWGETWGCGARMIGAFRRGDRNGMKLAALAIATNTLTSVAKSYAEGYCGVAVDEDGKGVGDRVKRSITGNIGKAYPRTQKLADAAILFSNIWTTIDRLNEAHKGRHTPNLDSTKRGEAKARFKVLGVNGFAIGALTVGTYYYLNRRLSEQEEILNENNEDLLVTSDLEDGNHEPIGDTMPNFSENNTK